MDTQDNLDLLRVKAGGVTTDIDLNQIVENSILFTFRENETCQVTLHSQHFSVICECHEEYETQGRHSEVTLVNDIDTIISENEHGLCPSNYRIEIFNIATDKKTTYSYEIKPLSSLTSNLYRSLITILKDRAPSCLSDRSTDSASSHIDEIGMTVFDLAQILSKNKPQILSSLHRARFHPITDIRKKVMVGEGKENDKSMKRAILNPNSSYTYKTYEDKDNDENHFLVYILKKSQKQLDVLQERLRHAYQADSLEQTNLSSLQIKPGAQKKSSLQEKIESIQETKTMTETYLNDLHQISLSITETVKDTPDFTYQSGKGRITQRFLMNHDYALLYRLLYQPLQNEIPNEDMPHHRYKQTSKLYEIYCLLFLIDTLKYFGFVEKKNDNLEHLDVQDHDLLFAFHNKEYNAILLYDTPVKSIYEYNANNLHQLVSLNSTHNRPDYQILFFDKKDQFQYGIILDAKCRTYNSMLAYGKSSNTSESRTLMDYLQFRYPDAKRAIDMSFGTNDLILLAPLSYPEYLEDKVSGSYIFPVTPGQIGVEGYTKHHFLTMLKSRLYQIDEDKDDVIKPL